MKTGTFVFLAILIMAATCEHAPPQEGIRQDKSLAGQLKKAQETIMIDGKHVELTANVWRDFMPSIGKADNSMKAAVKVACANKIPLPEDLRIIRLIVVKADSVWVANIENSERLDQRIIHATAKNGPEWAVRDIIDVIVELDDGKQAYYLRKGTIPIEATY